MNKLIFTRLRGKTAAVLVSETRALQMDFAPETAAEETGTIYIGKVKNLVKNLNAAFVEYRPGINGYYSLSENRHHLYADGREHAGLKAGDEILVQVSRAAVKTKDAVLSSELTLTGQYAVITSRPGKLGISSKIHDQAWRAALKEQWESSQSAHTPDYSLVIRTNAYGADTGIIWQEAAALREKLSAVLAAAACRTCYSVLYRPDSFVIRAAKNLYSCQTEEIVTDVREIYEELKSGFLSGPQSQGIPVRFYDDERLPLAALYHLNTELDRALARNVWLKSGGYLVIEPTEAMTVIDVNTGKNAEKKSVQETYLRTNLEAAAEIALQLRLRNLSGIIIVDFIDMNTREAKEELLKTLRRYLAHDPVKTTLVDMTALGLAEITRKKIRRPLHEQVTQIPQIFQKNG